MRTNKFIISIVVIMVFVTASQAEDEGLKNYKEKKFEDAKLFYEQILSKEENFAANLGLGATQYQLGDIPNAAKSFEKVINSKNTDIKDEAYYNLGNVLYNQQKTEESLAFYRKALELNPGDEDAKFNYELAKYNEQQQQDQDQDNKDQNDQQDQQNQDNKKQDQSNNDENQQDKQDSDEQESDKQEDEESDSSEQEQRQAPKSQKQINAEAILDALKDDEKIHQKVKMAQQSKRKYEKDW